MYTPYMLVHTRHMYTYTCTRTDLLSRDPPKTTLSRMSVQDLGGCGDPSEGEEETHPSYTEGRSLSRITVVVSETTRASVSAPSRRRWHEDRGRP